MFGNEIIVDNWPDSLPTIHHSLALQLPGITEESRKITADLIKKNHSHHCFFNDKGFHNHTIHHLLAAFSLGASPKRLEQIYYLHTNYHRPIGDITGQPEITEVNWNQFFGQPEFYGNYLRFFTREVKSKGVDTVLTTYIFDTTKEGTSDFFACFMGGAFHPMIHVGYGLEFFMELVTVEGLAMAAVTKPYIKPILLDPPPITGAIETAMQAIASLTSSFGFSTPPTPPPTTSPSALSIIYMVHTDHSLDGIIKFGDELYKIPEVVAHIPEKVKEYAKMWVIDSTSKEDVLNKTKELIGVSMCVYAGPTRPGSELKLDFFLMHTLTSALFLPIFLSHLPLVHATRLLQAHFSIIIALFIAQGRPRLYLIENLLSYKSRLEGYNEETSNPWLKIIERALVHDDEHVVKVLRALLWGATHMDSFKEQKGTAGGCHFSENYWLNSAKMTLDTINGENWWNQAGIGFDEAWNGKPDRLPSEIFNDKK